MADRDTIQADVEGRIIDLNTEVQARIVEWIQRAQTIGEEKHGFLAMEAEVSFTTVTSQRSLGTAPSDWLRHRDRPWFVDGRGGRHPMEWLVSDHDESALYSDEPTEVGKPKHVRELASSFEVFPLPDGLAVSGSVYSDGQYRVHLPYYKTVGALDSGGASNFWTTDGRYYLEHYAAAQALHYNRDREESIAEFALAEAELQRLIRRDKRDRLPRNVTLRPRGGRGSSRTGRLGIR